MFSEQASATASSVGMDSRTRFFAPFHAAAMQTQRGHEIHDNNRKRTKGPEGREGPEGTGGRERFWTGGMRAGSAQGGDGGAGEGGGAWGRPTERPQQNS